MSVDQSLVPDSPGTFQSSATTMDGFWRDLYDYVGSRRRDEGRASPAYGVSKPTDRDNVSSWDDVVSAVQGLTNDDKKRRGGSGLDTAITQPEDTYGQRRYDFISGEEGSRSRSYKDTKGNMTVGIGFNMDAPGNRDQFKRVLNVDDDVFDAVRDGKRSLTENQIRKLFDASVQEAEDFIKQKFDGVDLLDHQRLALVSLAFNSPSLIGPNLERFIREGNLEGARDEILYGSGEEARGGVPRRRYKEAGMFIGPMKVSALPNYKDYINSIA